MAKVKISNTIVQNVCTILKMDGDIEEACRHAGIAKQTHYNWMKRKQPILDEFGQKIYYKDEIEKSQDVPRHLARSTRMKAIRDGNVKAAIEFMKLRDERYRPKQENIEITPPIDEKDLIDD